MDGGGAEAALHDHIGGGEAGLHLALLVLQRAGDVAGLAVAQQEIVQDGGARGHRLLHVDDMGQHLVVDLDQLGRVLGDRARLGHHRHHPLPGIADQPVGQRIALDLRRIDADIQRIDRRAQLGTGQHIAHPGQRQRFGACDRLDACRGIRTGDDRHVQHAGQLDVGGIAAAPGDEARVFLGAPFGTDVAKAVRRSLLSHGPVSYRLPLPAATRRAASCTASTICW